MSRRRGKNVELDLHLDKVTECSKWIRRQAKKKKQSKVTVEPNLATIEPKRSGRRPNLSRHIDLYRHLIEKSKKFMIDKKITFEGQ